MEQLQWLENELKRFAGKFYMNIFWQRLALFILAVFIVVVSFSFIEYSFWFDGGVRFFLFWGFLSLNITLFGFFLARPLLQLLGVRRRLSKHDFALVIGRHFESINDRILNILELEEGNFAGTSRELLLASISQKIDEIKFFRFFDAIDRKKTIRRLPLLIMPLLLVLIMGFVVPDVLINPLQRISDYNTEYVRPAPFSFIIQNKNLESAQNNDFTVVVKLSGSEIPEEVFLNQESKSIRMNESEKNTFQYTLKSVKNDIRFHFSADDYSSNEYTLKVYKMPSIVSYSLQVSYPSHTGKQPETINNINSLNVPRGTMIRFLVLTRDADRLTVKDGIRQLEVSRNERYFVFDKLFDQNIQLFAVSSREGIHTADSLEFNISVIPDEYPEISVKEEIDSTMFMLRYFSGKISDDYGLSKLIFSYKYYSALGETDSVININISHDYNLQEFYNAFDFSIFNLQAGDRLEYFFTVYDNDAYAGPKASKSQIFSFRMPTQEEMRNMVNEKSDAVGKGLENLFEEAAKIQSELDKFQKDTRGKKNLTWEEQERLRELLNKEKELQNNLEKINQQNSERMIMSEQLNEFNQQLYEKQKMIDELMNQLMDDEFMEMLKKLEELMEKGNQNPSQNIENLNQKNEDLLRNMEQTIELLNRSLVEEKLQSLQSELKDKGEMQEKLAESDKSLKEQQSEQEKLNAMFEEMKKNVDSLKSKNEELEDPFPLDFVEDAMQEIDSTMKAASDQLNSGKQNKASKSQKQAGEKMQELSDQISEMMNESDSEQQAEDIGLLRELLENLITISFDQEALMRDVASTRIADPRYFDNMRKQKKINDALQIIDDSLMALGKRNPLINSYISDELSKIDVSRKKSLEYMNNRYIQPATREQQNVMMGVNNLALLLADALKQMQQQQNQSMQQKSGNSACKNPGNKPGQGKGNKPGQGQGNKPSAKTLRQLQEQLNQQMEGLRQQMESGQGQQGWSEQLAKMAAQQEAIRKAMQEYQQQLNSEGAGNGKELNKSINDMEKTEEDLVNKRLTTETINRQKQILTRLLESEKAEMEREKDPKRQSNEAKVFNNGNPMTFFKYNSLKRNSTEILKTVPPNLNPYYKQKVNEYLYKMK
ncbi:MAG: hypothetical protein CVU11_01000 [Bacteroidetes bacterium HGW-Bacteroidetes-6]|jgi:hypothetical protein|nr:MAG: hypothetical protein CVU11_01000 [Bacteroidetes bacterium HGW-Bacteroidetes-6]